MAVKDYKRGDPCLVNGCVIPSISKGMCNRHYTQLRTHGIVGPREQICKQCGSTFVAEHTRKYCSAKCSETADNRRSGARPLAIVLAEKRNPAHYFVCEQCGKDTHRVMGGTNKKTGYKQRWCSMGCRVKWNAEHRPAAFSQIHYNKCVACKKQWIGRRASTVCSPDCAKEAARVRSLAIYYAHRRKELDARASQECAGCKLAFVPERSSTIYCSDRCANRAEKRRRGSSSHRARARQFGVWYEPVNPLKVFERDGWRCQICGTSTPKSRRGTLHQNAPELDHVVALVNGGAHSYLNTQCACRRCNSIKGSGPARGQMNIFSLVSMT